MPSLKTSSTHFLRISGIILIFLLSTASSFSFQKVAVIGTTGNIARTAIYQLSQANIPTRCLLRHDITSDDGTNNKKTIDNVSVTNGDDKKENISSSSRPPPPAEIASALSQLEHVEMVQGDITNRESILELIQGCDAVLCLQGPPRPNPFKSLFPFLSDPNDPRHPYMINYVGMQNVIDAVRQTPSVKRIVRLTGKGEQPFSVFTILINMLGCMAKAWNYQGEQLLRESGLNYTIVRPGLLKSSKDYQIPYKGKMIVDNGMDMKVSPVTYDQIAEVCIQSLCHDNCAESTLTVMNVDENQGEESYDTLLEKVQSDDKSRFKESLLEQHRMGARLGFVAVSLMVTGIVTVVSKAIAFVVSILF